MGVDMLISSQDESELAVLCRDRPQRTDEIFHGNAFYGIDAVIKQYTGLPQSQPLRMVIPHGVYLDEKYMWDAELTANLPLVWCYPEFRKHVYLAHDMPVVLSASPFVYLVEMQSDKIEASQSRAGTLFFPHHSTHHLTVEMDYQILGKALSELDEKFHPISICMYWKDVLLGHDRPFTEMGFPVVTAGHIYDPDFLFRLYRLLVKHKFAGGNGLGSHIFYAIEAGCQYFHFETDYRVLGSEEARRRDIPNTSHRGNYLRDVFRFPEIPDFALQREIADYYLGKQYRIDRRDLEKLITRAEWLDALQCVYPREKSIPRLRFPPRIRRILGSVHS